MSWISALWLPILLSAVAVFILSSILHMVLPWHKSDYPSIPNEDAVMDALRPFNIPPAEYMVPKPSGSADMKSAEFKARLDRGPVFIINMLPNGMGSMGRPLAMWFVYLLLVAGLAGHIAYGAIHPGTRHAAVFHTIALSSLMGYSFALWQGVIWYRRPWMNTLKSTIDGFVYAVVTGLIFAWLWPK